MSSTSDSDDEDGEMHFEKLLVIGEKGCGKHTLINLMKTHTTKRVKEWPEIILTLQNNMYVGFDVEYMDIDDLVDEDYQQCIDDATCYMYIFSTDSIDENKIHKMQRVDSIISQERKPSVVVFSKLDKKIVTLFDYFKHAKCFEVAVGDGTNYQFYMPFLYLAQQICGNNNLNFKIPYCSIEEIIKDGMANIFFQNRIEQYNTQNLSESEFTAYANEFAKTGFNSFLYDWIKWQQSKQRCV